MGYTFRMHGLGPTAPILAFILGGGEIFLILAVVLILFGSKWMPELWLGLCQGIHEFTKGCKDVRTELDQGAFDAGRSLGGIHGKPAAQAITQDNETAELYDPAAFRKADKREPGSWSLRFLWALVIGPWKFLQRLFSRPRKN